MAGMIRFVVGEAKAAFGLLLLTAEDVLIGGQAVIEGVLMRSPHFYAVAVRRPSGNIAVMQSFLARPSEAHGWLRFPLLRGLGTFWQALVLGLRALHYSAEQVLESADAKRSGKPSSLTNWMLAVNLVTSLGLFVFLYKFVPLFLSTRLAEYYPSLARPIAFNLVDGLIRLALFLGLLLAVGQWREMQRIFQYHGAEHKVVWAFEKGTPVDLASARAQSRFHPRCGTSFLLVVMAIAVFLYVLLPFKSFVWRFLGRLLLLPFIAGVSYEFIRFAARKRGKLWGWASEPGLWLQRITTREPDDAQIETAICALETAMEAERQHAGELVVA